MSALIDLTGYKNGKLKVIERAGRRGHAVLWRVYCRACKRTWVMRAHVIRRGAKSCGCLRRSGDKSPRAKLSWPRVRTIRQRWAERETNPITQRSLARAYRVSRWLIGMVVNEKAWIEKPARRAAGGATS